MTSVGIDTARLRRHAVGRSLFGAPSLALALQRLGFVQADPIRAPARSQDLVLRHRVSGYRAGDLEQFYPDVGVEEDFFVNYGFVQPAIQALMHPRTPRTVWDKETWRQAHEMLDFIRARGETHPRDVHRHFSRGTVKNVWGGTSSATTKMLDSLHYRGFLKITRRESGIRLYAAKELGAPVQCQEEVDARLDALVDAVVWKYAPLPATGLSTIAGRLRYGAPQWRAQIAAAIRRAKKRLSHVRVDNVDWYWPAEEQPPTSDNSTCENVRLLSPFDPVVWDRVRFKLLWGWAYRFEGYIPPDERRFGYYALPVLWCDDMVGWANASIEENSLAVKVCHLNGCMPNNRRYARALDEELERMRIFARTDSYKIDWLDK